MLNVGFVGTRFAGTDGVSLETEKWERVLNSLENYETFWFAGEIDRPSDRSMLVKKAHFNTAENIELNNLVFGKWNRSKKTTETIYKRKEYLKAKLYRFLEKYHIDLIVAENCLAIPMQIPLGMALSEVIAETALPAIAHHHDFFWERTRFLVNSIKDILDSSFPPDLPSIHHVVINSMIQKDLAAKRSVTATVIPNVVDFLDNRPGVDDFNRDFRKNLGFTDDDILILQPTRIVSRKGIEQALHLVKRLELPNTHLIISHSAGDEGTDYYDWLIETAEQQKVPVHFIYNRLNEKRKYDEQGNKMYTLWDVYPHVNLITYPSLYEGFGNAFLEAVLFKKPVLVNRYSVYVVDIEPKGFDVIAIDGYLTQKAVDEVRRILMTPELREKMGEKNFELGKKYFSMEVLKRRLSNILNDIYGEI